MNLNKVFILGNVTRDPESRTLPSGQSLTSFGIATNRFYTDRTGEKKQDAEFHNVTAFGKLADISAQYLTKGSLVLIEGRLRTHSWQDSTGAKRFRTEIIAENLQLGPRSALRAYPATEQKTAEQEEIPIIEEEQTSKQPASEKNKSEENEKELNDKSIPAENTNSPGNIGQKQNFTNPPEEEIDVNEIPF